MDEAGVIREDPVPELEVKLVAGKVPANKPKEKMAMLESAIVNKILKSLMKEGGYWVKIHGGMYQAGGLPDIVGCRGGQTYGFEVKTPKAYAMRDHNLTLRQQVTLARLKAAGAVIGVVTSAEEVIQIMETEHPAVVAYCSSQLNISEDPEHPLGEIMLEQALQKELAPEEQE